MNYLAVESLFDVELVRLAIFLSALVSLLVYERWGVSTGGTIVAGYLALWFPQPSHVIVTLLIAIATWALVHKVLRPRFMLWGRRLFESEIVVALALQSLWFAALLVFSALNPNLAHLYGIGFLLPGIMAHDMGRQGVRKTTGLILASAAVIFLILLVLGALRDLAGIPPLWGSPVIATGETPLAYPLQWLVIGVNISVILNIFLYHHWNLQGDVVDDSVRTGGFVTAAYLALMLSRPSDLVVIVICSVLTYLFVTQVMMRQALLFGRTKLSMMFLAAFVITALVEWALHTAAPGFILFSGFNAIIPTLVALLANDAQRQGVGRTAMGAALSTVGVFGTMSLLGVIASGL